VEAAVTPVVGEVTTRLCQQGVNEVKVRGGKGVLNGAPFFLVPRLCLLKLPGLPFASEDFRSEINLRLLGLGCVFSGMRPVCTLYRYPPPPPPSILGIIDLSMFWPVKSRCQRT
jgi:hypothetical protein